MILRWLWLAFFIAALWFVRRVLLAMRDEPGRVRGGRLSEAMVRDRVCNTFLPRSKALLEQDDRGEHFFCSETCRNKFLAERNSRKA